MVWVVSDGMSIALLKTRFLMVAGNSKRMRMPNPRESRIAFSAGKTGPGILITRTWSRTVRRKRNGGHHPIPVTEAALSGIGFRAIENDLANDLAGLQGLVGGQNISEWKYAIDAGADPALVQ